MIACNHDCKYFLLIDKEKTAAAPMTGAAARFSSLHRRSIPSVAPDGTKALVSFLTLTFASAPPGATLPETRPGAPAAGAGTTCLAPYDPVRSRRGSLARSWYAQSKIIRSRPDASLPSRVTRTTPWWSWPSSPVTRKT